LNARQFGAIWRILLTMDNKSRNTDFFITQAAEHLAELERMVACDEFTQEYLKIRAFLTVMLDPNSGFEEPERQAMQAIEARARELMKAHDQATEVVH